MIMRDFCCANCGTTFEALVNSDQSKEQCVVCGNMAEKIISAAHVHVLNDPVRKAESLKKRSREDSHRQVKDRIDELAPKMGGRPKVQNPWNLRKHSK